MEGTLFSIKGTGIIACLGHLSFHWFYKGATHEQEARVHSWGDQDVLVIPSDDPDGPSGCAADLPHHY